MKRTSRFLKLKFVNREFSNVNFRKDVWTSERVVKSPCKDIVIPKITLDEYLWRNLDKWPEKTAAVSFVINKFNNYMQNIFVFCIRQKHTNKRRQ